MPETTTPTWVRQVLDEHRELRRKKDRVRDYLERPRPEVGASGAHTWAAGLAAHMLSLHDELFRHFRFEDEGGMVEEIRVRHPRATGEVERLVTEHPEMLREVRKLVHELLRYSEGRRPDVPSLRCRVTILLDRLERHESEETSMIHDLTLQDLGLGD